MFKRIRIAILLYVLAFVALGQFLEARRATDWNDPLWVDVYLVNGSGSQATQNYIDGLPDDAFTGLERFFETEASRFDLGLEQPFRLRVAGTPENRLPPMPEHGRPLETVLWSLKMRWFVWRLHANSDFPTPDATVFAIYYEAADGVTLDRSTALQKGLIAIANLYATHVADGSNQMIIAHELLHTLGATDKYDLSTGLPNHPLGFAEPDREPLYPQLSAELMAGRIPLQATKAVIPESLRQVVIGRATAAEIGWIAAAGGS